MPLPTVSGDPISVSGTVDISVRKMINPNTVLDCGGITYRVMVDLQGPLRIVMDRRGQLVIQREGVKPALLTSACDLSDAA